MQEVRHDGIRVSMVAPGSVQTGFIARVTAPAPDWKLAPTTSRRSSSTWSTTPTRSLPSRVEIRPSRPPRK